MRYNRVLQIVIIILSLFSCEKEHAIDAGAPRLPALEKKILVKDITLPGLPSPYYHLEYNADSTVSKVDFASGYTIYDVLYNGNKIAEMRNNIFVNHDTLRYIYDGTGKLTMINFINGSNVIYRHAIFIYNAGQVKEIEWSHKQRNAAGFVADRTLTFTYYPDGNVKAILQRRIISAMSYLTSSWQFDQYDDKINVEDFSLAHDGIHDHLFLLQGFRLQRNNPRKETYSEGETVYTVEYNYTYNSDDTPSLKAGSLLYTAGPNTGKRLQISTIYTYY